MLADLDDPLGLGPDGDGAHALTEHVLLSSLPTRAALTAGLLLRLTEPGALA